MVKRILEILIKFLQSKLNDADVIAAMLLAKYPRLSSQDVQTICEIIADVAEKAVDEEIEKTCTETGRR